MSIKTQKQKLEYVKENRFLVYLFVDGKRSESIVSCDIFTAFHSLAKWIAEGEKVVLVAEIEEGYLDHVNKLVIEYEEMNRKRIPHYRLYQYSCVYNQTLERWEPAFK